MCTYSSDNGAVSDFHLSHLDSLSRGGAGLVIVEATAVSPEGRITPRCLGIWDDLLANRFRPLVEILKTNGAVAGIQLAHAGRKGSSSIPWEGDEHISGRAGGWETISPSALAFGGRLTKTPKAMSLDDIWRIQVSFEQAAERARAVGFEWLQLHFAHGYLGQSFLCPESNSRTDEYGGSLPNRARFMLEVVERVRAVWPNEFPLTVRLGMTDFGAGHLKSLNESLWVARQLELYGVDLIDVSMGFNTPNVDIPRKAGVLREVAHQLKETVDIPVSVAWGLGNPELANEVVEFGDADLIGVGKGHLENPHWPYHAAKVLGVAKSVRLLPVQYGFWLGKAESV